MVRSLRTPRPTAATFVDAVAVFVWLGLAACFALRAPPSLSRDPLGVWFVVLGGCGAFAHALLLLSRHFRSLHGNRVRRWLSRSEIEMSEVHVEFEGGCLLRVTLRHMPGDRWHVYSFASHAG
jgi:hypothetical protein